MKDVKWPTYLPSEYNYLKSADDPLMALLKHPIEHQAAFFIESTEDHTWSKKQGKKLLHDLFLSFTEKFFDAQLGPNLALQIVRAAQAHMEALSEVLPKDMTLIVGEDRVKVSRLLFAVQSPLFREIMKDASEHVVERLTPEVFWLAFEFLYTAKLENLWKSDPEKIHALICEVSKMNFHPLARAAAKVYKRYLNEKNLLQHYQQGVLEIAEICQDWISENVRGLEFVDGTLTITLWRGSYNDYLEIVAPKVVSLHIQSADEEIFPYVAKMQKLTHLSFEGAPKPEVEIKLPSLLELNFNDCNWLSDDELIKFLQQTPRLQKLHVRGTPISFRSVGVFQDLPGLGEIDLTFCPNIDSDALDLLEATAPQAEIIR